MCARIREFDPIHMKKYVEKMKDHEVNMTKQVEIHGKYE
mgnify:CR=1 FL=1